ncbi:MAG: ABC transporter substrate-binding protein [Eubacteriales bacterium]|nr:ABC transporter substrate-binding protein [Eubacteriales bacterium]MDD4078467.1 ABC transporter substrate-binding protein [Eubacteriales bacterium]
MARKFKVYAVLLLAIAIVLTMLPGCKKDTEGLTKVRLNEVTHSVFYAPLYVAVNLGLFAEEGIDLDFTTGQGADHVMTALLSGQADIGFMGPEASIYVYNQGQADYAINFAQLTQRDGSFLVARKPMPDFTWEDVRGKSIIGGRPGGMPLMTLEYVLKNQGLMPGEDVEVLTHIQFALMGGAFTGGEGDFVTLFEPVATTLELANEGYVVASVGADSGEIPYTAFSAAKSYIEKNPDIIQAFTNAIYKGQIWVAEHTPAEIAEVIQPSFPDSDLETLTLVAARYKEIDAWRPDPLFKQEAFELLQDVMVLAGELDTRAPFEKLVTNEFAEKAMEDSE